MRMSRHEKAIRDEIAEIETEIGSIEAERDALDRRHREAEASRTMLLDLLEKAESTPGEPAAESTDTS